MAQALQDKEDELKTTPSEAVCRILAELGWTVTHSDNKKITAVRGRR